jgi:uncharacterized glyoxalase superfamily protein PhnB
MPFNRLTPNLMVENVRESIAFYHDVLGFEVFTEVPNETVPEIVNFAILGRDAVQIMLQARASFHHDVPGTDGMPVGASMTFYLDVTEIAALVEPLRSRVSIVKDLHTTWYGAQEFYFRDPNGYIWCFAQGAS